MELRETFNTSEENYDRYRPGYPEELFSDIFSYAGLEKRSSVIEIGTGTGQATLPFLQKGCKVIGIELGDRLSEYARRKFSAYENFRIITGDFCDVELAKNSCDLVFSATAFHWLPVEEALRKVKKILRPGGTLTLFWNHPFPNREDDPTNMASRQVYDKYRPSPKKQVEFSEKNLTVWKDRLADAGFASVEAKLYRRKRTLTTEQYIGLLNTYSDHIALPKEAKRLFEEEMRRAVGAAGGSINIYDTIDLYMGKTPNY